MIYLDANEASIRSTLPVMKDVQISSDLESLTGSDIFITPIQAPLIRPLLESHIKAGAMMVQRKSGMDFVSSVLDKRLAHSIAVMTSLHAHPRQCILLTTGRFERSEKSHNVLVNGDESQISYLTYQNSLIKWTNRGGVCFNLNYDYEIPQFLSSLEQNLLAAIDNPIKEVWLTNELRQDNPFQGTTLVKDGRAVLVQLPHIGTKTANALWEFFNQDLSAVLCALTDPIYLKAQFPIKGIGKKIIEDCRLYFNLENMEDDHYQIMLTTIERITKL